MVSELLALLVRLSIVPTLAVLVIGLLRWPGRRAVGPEGAYWLWLLVPSGLVAALLPHLVGAPAVARPPIRPSLTRVMAVPADFAPGVAASHYALTTILIWILGATVALAYLIYCQQVLKRSLGALQLAPDGTYRSTAVKQPMLIGALRPQIVVPADFENCYSASERTLILAHERAHIERGDALTSCVALVLVCLCWFNPLMYWARNRFRFDQEVACDAAVLRQLKVSRRSYARALAKSQLSMATAIGFGWARRHPLIKRVALLKRPTPSRARRAMGQALALMLMCGGAYAAWAAQPDLPTPSVHADARIGINLRWSIDGTEVLAVGHGSLLPDVTVRPGIWFGLSASSASGVSYSLQCMPSLRSATTEGPQDILMGCELSRAGTVFARPSILVPEGQTGTIQMKDPVQNALLKIELNASTSGPKVISPDSSKWIAIDAKDTDVREVVEMIARKGGLNVMVSDEVRGKITVRLKDVSAREALDILAHSRGLGLQQAGNVTYVDVAH
jgi:beta-lactamase regulating signal transducer with metallopeptidase domain